LWDASNYKLLLRTETYLKVEDTFWLLIICVSSMGILLIFFVHFPPTLSFSYWTTVVLMYICIHAHVYIYMSIYCILFCSSQILFLNMCLVFHLFTVLFVLYKVKFKLSCTYVSLYKLALYLSTLSRYSLKFSTVSLKFLSSIFTSSFHILFMVWNGILC
jgi:hypothetical protein